MTAPISLNVITGKILSALVAVIKKVATAVDLAELLYFDCSFEDFPLFPIQDHRFKTVASEIFVASRHFGREPLNGLAPAFTSKTLHEKKNLKWFQYVYLVRMFVIFN